MHAKRIESWMDELCILSKFTIPLQLVKEASRASMALFKSKDISVWTAFTA